MDFKVDNTAIHGRKIDEKDVRTSLNAPSIGRSVMVQK